MRAACGGYWGSQREAYVFGGDEVSWTLLRIVIDEFLGTHASHVVDGGIGAVLENVSHHNEIGHGRTDGDATAQAVKSAVGDNGTCATGKSCFVDRWPGRPRLSQGAAGHGETAAAIDHERTVAVALQVRPGDDDVSRSFHIEASPMIPIKAAGNPQRLDVIHQDSKLAAIAHAIGHAGPCVPGSPVAVGFVHKLIGLVQGHYRTMIQSNLIVSRQDETGGVVERAVFIVIPDMDVADGRNIKGAC